MHSATITGAPITASLLILTLTTSLLSTLTSTTHLLPLLLTPHLLSSATTPSNISGYMLPQHAQLWRLATYPLAYANTTELLFGVLAIWQMRVLERLWGSRKMLSFLLQVVPLTTLAPVGVMLGLRSAMPGWADNFDYIPPGPTGLVFAMLAQYQAVVPFQWRYTNAREEGGVLEGGRTDGEGEGQRREEGMVVTSKSMSYLLPAQLALSQSPGSVVVALCGWCVGRVWRRGLVWPGRGWRVPSWVVGGNSGGG